MYSYNKMSLKCRVKGSIRNADGLVSKARAILKELKHSVQRAISGYDDNAQDAPDQYLLHFIESMLWLQLTSERNTDSKTTLIKEMLQELQVLMSLDKNDKSRKAMESAFFRKLGQHYNVLWR